MPCGLEADRKALRLPVIMPSLAPVLSVYFLSLPLYSDRSFFWFARITPTTSLELFFVRCFSFRSYPLNPASSAHPSAQSAHPHPPTFHTDSSFLLLLLHSLLPALFRRPPEPHRTTTPPTKNFSSLFSSSSSSSSPSFVLLLFSTLLSERRPRKSCSYHRSFVQLIPQPLLLPFQRPGPGDLIYAVTVGGIQSERLIVDGVANRNWRQLS